MRCLVLALLCLACHREERGPGLPTNSQAPDAGEAWKEVDTGPFSFHAPVGIVREDVQGTDSYVGKYRVEGITLTFDYGRYSNSLSDYPEVAGPLIDGHAARWVEVRSSDDTWVGIA